MIWFDTDCEYGFHGRRVGRESALEPVVFCAINGVTRERHHFWGRDDRLRSFVEDHRDDLWVSHNNTAEMKYLLRFGIGLPPKWFDTYVAWRRITNAPGFIGASLIAALDTLKLPHTSLQYKHELRERILVLDFDPVRDRDEITEYCYDDCAGCGAIYTAIADQIDPVAMAYWVEYMKAVSRMELRGIPVDIGAARMILNSRGAIVDHLQHKVNQTWPIYDGGIFKRREFLRWCDSVGIRWPWTRSKTTGRFVQPLDNDTLKSMESQHPFIALIRQVRKTCNSFNRQSGIKFDGVTKRHYFSTYTFRSITGRNQPRDFIFTEPKWYRWLIVPPSRDHVLVYVDYIAEEIAIAAALSGDGGMRSIYEQVDPHIAFAIRASAAPPTATKKSHPAVRNRYKTVNLGLLYGQTEYGIADRLGIDVEEAKELVDQHKELFPAYHSWSRRVVQQAYNKGVISTRLGWRCKVPPVSNFRTWGNWPVQAAGSDLMRLTTIYLDRQNVQLLGIVHDGFLLSCRRDQLDDLRTAVDAACALAVRQVLDDFPLRWDVTVYNHRFEDEDGAPLWNLMIQALRQLYGSSPVSP